MTKLDPTSYRFDRIAGVQLAIDVGAYNGTVARYLQHLHPCARIHCFEPNPRAFKELVKDPPGVCLQSAVVGDRKAMADFQIGSRTMTSGVVGRAKTGGRIRETIRVTCCHLPLYLAALGNPVVDTLKLDCEGCEAEILESFDAAGLRRLRYVVGEWHQKEQLNRVLAALGPTHQIEYNSHRGRIGNFWALLKP